MELSWNGKRGKISTHTPAWGVTPERLVPFAEIPISTHTPAWGVTDEIMEKEED